MTFYINSYFSFYIFSLFVFIFAIIFLLYFFQPSLYYLSYLLFPFAVLSLQLPSFSLMLDCFSAISISFPCSFSPFPFSVFILNYLLQFFLLFIASSISYLLFSFAILSLHLSLFSLMSGWFSPHVISSHFLLLSLVSVLQSSFVPVPFHSFDLSFLPLDDIFINS